MKSAASICIVVALSFFACSPKHLDDTKPKLDEGKAITTLGKYASQAFFLHDFGPFYIEGDKRIVTFKADKNTTKYDCKATFEIAQDGKWYLAELFCDGGVSAPNVREHPSVEVK